MLDVIKALPENYRRPQPVVLRKAIYTVSWTFLYISIWDSANSINPFDLFPRRGHTSFLITGCKAKV